MSKVALNCSQITNNIFYNVQKYNDEIKLV